MYVQYGGQQPSGALWLVPCVQAGNDGYVVGRSPSSAWLDRRDDVTYLDPVTNRQR